VVEDAHLKPEELGAETAVIQTPVDILDTGAAGPAAIRGGTLRAAGYVAGILLTLATAPFLVRHLGVVGFGQYMLVISLLAAVSGLTDAGLTYVGIREYAVRQGAARDALVRNLLGIRLALTFAGVAVATAFAIVAGYDRTLVLGTLVMGAALLLQMNQNVLTIPLATELRLGWVSAIDLLRQVVSAIAILALVVAGASLLPFFVASVAGGMVALAVTVVLVRRTIPLRPAFDPKAWWALLRDTLPFALATSINAAYLRIAIVALSLLGTELETGYFATSYRIVEVALALPALIVGAVFPIMARAVRDDLARLAYGVRRVFEVSLILGVWLALCIELGAPFAIHVIAGNAAEPSVDILRIQGLAVIATFVTMACGYPLLALRQHRALLIANGVALAVSIVLLVALVPSYEARGAAVATVGAEIGLAIATAVLLLRAHPEIRLPLGSLPVVALAAAIAGAIFFVPGLHDVVRVAIASVLYFGVLGIAGAIPHEIRTAFTGGDR
jgi:O-antigen/teichoic acid export membrane protein